MARGPDLGDRKRVRPRLGRTQQEPRPKLFVARVLAAQQLAGFGQRTGGRGPASGRAPAIGGGRGGGAAWMAGRSLLADRSRRVIVKARIVRQRPRMPPLRAHLAYLRREGVTRDGAPARMFDATSEEADASAFAERCAGDRHHFRFIVSPEDAAELTDLHAYTRDLVQDMERDLGTSLDWIAVDHWNTDNPHVHLLVRGAAQDGNSLVIHREYISRGLRARAVDLATVELGPRSERQIRSKLAGELDAERWTGLDRTIQRAGARAAGGVIDMRPDAAGARGDGQIRALVIGRLQRLERMGLARPVGPAQWLLAEEAEPTLRDLGLRGDIIKTMNRALGRPPTDLAIHERAPNRPLVGRVAAKGLHDELAGTPYLMIDGTDGRTHYVRVGAGVDLADIPDDGIVRVAPRRDGRGTTPWVHMLSHLPIEAQIGARGATWLDRELVGHEKTALAATGFGAEVTAALERRTEALMAHGLARRRGQQLVFARDLLGTLEQGEIEEAAARMAKESRLAYRPVRSGEAVRGVYRRRVDLVSGRFALIETEDRGFTLVPWRREVDRALGREISAVVRGREVAWSFGLDRGRDIG